MKPHADLILTPGKRMQALCEARGISRKELANRLRQNPDALQSVLRSPDGQRLLQLHSGSDGGQALQQAAQQAESGSTAQLVQLLRRVMSTPDGAALAGRIMQQLQQ